MLRPALAIPFLKLVFLLASIGVDETSEIALLVKVGNSVTLADISAGFLREG